jgi:hypothetical protein
MWCREASAGSGVVRADGTEVADAWPKGGNPIAARAICARRKQTGCERALRMPLAAGVFVFNRVDFERTGGFEFGAGAAAQRESYQEVWSARSLLHSIRASVGWTS